ncbi:MAG: hypothetical protein AUH01_04270 [Acidobacteria bacterium 13_2_20CM_56_17]|nr:MAG: hypothetical protein AUH01_04270 [Acidobacteria bacterium 13_2_20CM_56_17]
MTSCATTSNEKPRNMSHIESTVLPSSQGISHGACKKADEKAIEVSSSEKHSKRAYGPVPNNTNRRDDEGVLFSGLRRTKYCYGRSIAQ